MPAETRGSIYEVGSGYGIRWPENGKRMHQAPFETNTAARRWFTETVAPRLRKGTPDPTITFDAFCDLFLGRHGATVSAYIGTNPAVEPGRNTAPRSEEMRPFTLVEIDSLAAELASLYGAMVVFAAETGLRTNEWAGLERRDVDKTGKAVTVQRRVSDGVLTGYPKTERSRRRVPLTVRALAALESLPPRIDTPLLFPGPDTGYIYLDYCGLTTGARRSMPPGSIAEGPTTCGTPSRRRRLPRASRSSS